MQRLNNTMSERDHVGQVQDMVQALELDLAKITAALSTSAAGDHLAAFSEPASMKSRLKDSEQELLLLPS
jgi:hypothetical protein